MSYFDTSKQVAFIGRSRYCLVLRVFADTGKTAALEHCTQVNPESRMFHLAYKLAAWEGAERQSFFNVVCKISHQLSCANFGCHYQHWSARSLHINEVARQLNTRARQALVLNELLRVLMGSEGNTFAGGPPC